MLYSTCPNCDARVILLDEAAGTMAICANRDHQFKVPAESSWSPLKVPAQSSWSPPEQSAGAEELHRKLERWLEVCPEYYVRGVRQCVGCGTTDATAGMKDYAYVLARSLTIKCPHSPLSNQTGIDEEKIVEDVHPGAYLDWACDSCVDRYRIEAFRMFALVFAVLLVLGTLIAVPLVVLGVNTEERLFHLLAFLCSFPFFGVAASLVWDQLELTRSREYVGSSLAAYCSNRSLPGYVMGRDQYPGGVQIVDTTDFSPTGTKEQDRYRKRAKAFQKYYRRQFGPTRTSRQDLHVRPESWLPEPGKPFVKRFPFKSRGR